MTLFSPFLSAQHAAIAVHRKHPLLGGAALVASVLIAVLGAFLIGPFNSRAVQAPVMSLDMVPGDNTYDDTTNTMTVNFNPEADFCLASATANPATHIHQSHLIIQNVEDLIGWQVRLNYDGGKMRPLNQHVTPFTDNTTAQGVGFTNLPIDQVSSVHRDVTAAASIPPQAPGPQTALLGATYNAEQNAAVSPDTPAKSTPDDTSYSAPAGGVLSQIALQVVGNQTGQTLFMDLDDGSPNPPGSALVIFSGTGTTVPLAETSLGDGLHVEGGTCPPPTVPPTSAPTPTVGPSSTPPPSPGPGGSFNPSNTATYCAEGTGDIDDQQLTVSCQPDISPGSHPDIVGSFNLGVGPDGQPRTADDTNDYNFAGLVNFSPTVPDDTAIPVGAILGRLGSQPTLGLVNNGCGNSQLRVPFTFMKGTTDNTDLVYPQPFGQTNDLAILAGDNPPYGSQDVNPPPAAAHYPSFLNAIFDPDWVDYGPDKIAGNADDNNGPAPALKPVFRAIGTSIIGQAGYLSVILQLVVFDKGTTLPNFPALDPAYGYPAVVVLQQSSAAGSAAPPAPSALTDFCTPLKTVGVSYGVTKDNPDTPANEGGIPVRTLPSAGTQIAGITYAASQRDADGDGFENSIDPCPYTPDTVWNARDVTPPIEGDSDLFTGVQSPDGIPDSCDPTPYEPSAAPPANSPIDHDGDGFLNRGDNCPLVANPDQRDTDKNAAGEEVGDGIGDACDLNPGTPDGAEILCIKVGSVTVGGDPNVAISPCLTELPPVGGSPTPTPGGPTPTPPGVGTLTVVKDAIPNSSQSFSFEVTLPSPPCPSPPPGQPGGCAGGGGTGFSLHDDGVALNSAAVIVPVGTAQVKEVSIASGWALTSIVCDDGSTTDVSSASAFVDVSNNEHVTCTYTNERLASATPTPAATPTPRSTPVVIPSATATPTGTPPPTPTATAPPIGGESCDGRTATKIGTDESEVLRGTSGNDVIVAKGGADVILGLGGDDIICAGSGRDRVFAGGGNDRVFGEGGGDVLLGGRGDDFLDGGAGRDRCICGPGHDIVENCERGHVGDNGEDDADQDNSDNGRDKGEGDRERNGSRGAFVDLAGAIY